MKKTIISITLFSFAFLSLHVHTHEHDHELDSDYDSYYITVEEDCGFCLFNSENTLAESSTFSAQIHFKNITFHEYIVNYISFKLFCFLNKSPPQ